MVLTSVAVTSQTLSIVSIENKYHSDLKFFSFSTDSMEKIPNPFNKHKVFAGNDIWRMLPLEDLI